MVHGLCLQGPSPTQPCPLSMSPEQRPLDTQVHRFKEDPSNPERFHVYSKWTQRNPPQDIGSDLKLLPGKDNPPLTLRHIRSKTTLLCLVPLGSVQFNKFQFSLP